jgi:hypothetical protein
VAVRKGQRQRAQEQPGGDMAVVGTEADPQHSCGELSEQGKMAWRTGNGMDGGGKDGLPLRPAGLRAGGLTRAWRKVAGVVNGR